jgi:hypothetical protein
MGSMTSHSSEVIRTCPRCGNVVGSKSALAIHFWAQDGKLLHDVVFVKNARDNGVLMHMSADRECRGEISGYMGKLLIKLELSVDCDTSFVDLL